MLHRHQRIGWFVGRAADMNEGLSA
jgi:hypothetical protein